MSEHGTAKPKPTPVPERPDSVEFNRQSFNDVEHPVGAQLVREMLGRTR